jgi:hypothetical protein
MDDSQLIRDQFIESATKSSKALAQGDHKIANKQAKILKKLVEQMETGVADKNILVELLDHENIGVCILAAIDLLRINYEMEKAEKTLKRIVSMDKTKMNTVERLRVMAAKIQLKSWEEKGYVNR